jgi:two-component system, NarL family, sensor histidine kinase DevS
VHNRRQSKETLPLAPGEAEEQGSMQALHRATLSLFSDLSLDGVLLRITQAARELAGARYAALGIPDDHGGLDRFIALGMSDEEMKRVGHQPVGRGLLGEMLRSGETIRLPDLTAHPKSAGFPPGHPPMTSFLGVPITAYGRRLGHIYLTDKQDAEMFSLEDQRLIEMLASHAAAAIENARLYRQVLNSEAELTQRNEELELFNDLATAVSSAMDLDQLLKIMLERVIDLFEAEAGEFFLREEGEGTFYLALHSGEAGKAFWPLEHFQEGEGFVGLVAAEGRPVWTSDLASDPSLVGPAVIEAGFQSLVGVPLTARGHVVGVLSLAFRARRSFNPREVGLLEAVGAGVGIATENARLNRHARRVAVLEERERIGMDLHDGIIQSIYAVGLTVETTRIHFKESYEKGSERLEHAIAGLNAVIRDIRNYILDLQPSRIPTTDLAAAMSRLVREFKANTLADADLQLEATALAQLGRDSSAALFLITQEALANVAKHAHATRVWVSLRRVGQDVWLQIIDNGRGFDPDHVGGTLGHGLSNMQERARQIGSSFDSASSPGEGTTITVRLQPQRIRTSAKPAV